MVVLDNSAPGDSRYFTILGRTTGINKESKKAIIQQYCAEMVFANT